MHRTAIRALSSILLAAAFGMVTATGDLSAQEPAEGPLARAYSLYDAGEFGPALMEFQKVAKASGSAEACYMAGLMYHRGRGTKIDGKSAALWYGKAAEANLPQALTNLGVLLRDGDGRDFAPDRQKAAEMLRRAAYLEDPAGQLAYAALLINDPLEPDERIEGLAFMQILADGGDEAAIDNLQRLKISDDERRAVTGMHAQIARNMEQVRRMVAADRKRDQPAATGKSAVAEPEPSTRGAGVIRMQRVAIRDPMTDNAEALVMLAPSDWEFEGRIEWMLSESVLANPFWQAKDPQTGLTMQSLPYRQFTWTEGSILAPGQNHLGMTVAPPTRDPAQFVAAFWMPQVLSHLRDARLTQRQSLPALADLALREWGGRAQCDGWRLRYEYTVDGKPWQEDLVFALLFSELAGQVWTVTRCYSVRGPAGTLDRSSKVIHAIATSGSFTPRWIASWRVCQELLRSRARQVMTSARQLAATFAENQAHIQRIQSEIERDRAESWEAQSRARAEALGGVETWRDPWQERAVELPQGYSEAWVNQQGEYVLFETSGQDPNAGSAVRWQKMERIDRLGERTGR
jgi:hypothetical protein